MYCLLLYLPHPNLLLCLLLLLLLFNCCLRASEQFVGYQRIFSFFFSSQTIIINVEATEFEIKIKETIENRYLKINPKIQKIK